MTFLNLENPTSITKLSFTMWSTAFYTLSHISGFPRSGRPRKLSNKQAREAVVLMLEGLTCHTPRGTAKRRQFRTLKKTLLNSPGLRRIQKSTGASNSCPLTNMRRYWLSILQRYNETQ